QLDHPAQRLLKRIRIHVVRIAAEGGAAPRGVGGVGPGAAATPEVGLMVVGDPGAFECDSQRIAGEMGMAARRGITAHVHLELARRVAHGVDHAARYLTTRCAPVYT